MTAPPGEAQAQPTYYTADQVEALINSRLADLAEGHNQQLRQLADSLRGQVITFIPDHAGGVGNEIAETWSQAEQQKAWKAANPE